MRRRARGGWRVPAAIALVMAAASGALAMAGSRPAPTWATPPRAAFLIGSLSPSALAAVTDGLRRTGLQLIERAEVERLVREQDLAQQQHVDPASAIAKGRLIGGHVAIFAQAERDQIALSAVLVETGERAGMAVVAADGAADAAAKLAADAAERLPARGMLSPEAGAFTLDLGARHGVQVGDRFRVMSGSASAVGSPVAVATVTRVDADRATASVEGPAPERPAPAERIDR